MNKLAIIIPYYKITFFEDCLNSLVNQTNKNFNVYIGNDNSPNDPKELIEKYSDQLQINYKKFDDNLGKDNLVLQWDRCINMSKQEEWIQFLDSDDIIKSTKLETIENIDNSINFIYSDFHMLENNILLPPFVNISKFQFNLNNLIKYWDDGFNVPIHCPIFNKELINNIYFINEFKLHEDWLFWVTIFAQNKIEIEYVRKPLAIYRNHGKSNTKNQLKMRDNLYAVYLYAYNYVLGTVEKELLFQSILKKYTDCKYSNSFILQQLEKINNSKYFKLRKFIYKSFKL
ncbi:glycosyltransferase [Empedobacter falsenii]